MPAARQFTALFIAILVLLLVAACGSDKDDATPTPGSGGSEPTATDQPPPTATEGQDQLALDGTSWLLAGINGVDLDMQEPLTLNFEDGQASGYSGCNDYGGAYTASESGDFSMPESAQTDMDCETGMDLESDYLTDLQNATHYAVIEDQRLELSDAGGETLLVFTRDTREALDGTSWTLIEVDGEQALDNATPTLELWAGEASGSTGCNEFGGLYSATEAGEISFSDLFWTERACIEPEGLMEQEEAFLSALAEAASYERDIADGRLSIADAEGATRLVLSDRDEDIESASLAWTGWALTSISGRPVNSETLVTLGVTNFQIAGTIGCADYYGLIQTDSNGKMIEDQVQYNESNCGAGEPDESLVDDYLQGLESATSYQKTSTELRLEDTDGEEILTFERAMFNGGDLRGTSWKLRTMAGHTIIMDTSITMEFTKEGISGRSGCNYYGANYVITESGVISVLHIASTMMLCSFPPEIMEQESAFGAALSRARAYQLSGSGLEFLDGEGSTLLVFDVQYP